MMADADQPALEMALLAYDGATVSILSDARRAHGGSPNFLFDLVELCDHADPLVSDGATWILKADLAGGSRLGAALTARLVEALPGLPGWQGCLHVCQMVAKLDLTDGQRLVLCDWLRPLTEHDRPFLRAWATDAMCQLVDVDEADILLSRMAMDPAASVRARVRALRRR